MTQNQRTTARRNFLTAALSAPVMGMVNQGGAVPVATETPSPHSASRLLTVDYRRLVSRADLNWDTPASRSEEGMPVGNGRMGSLVWTSPSAIKFQINRPDVFAENCATNSFPARHTDYASGCGYVDIDFVDFGDDVFTGQGFGQHLSAYDALVTVKGKGVTARILAWNERDVMAVEVSDEREQPAPINIDLRMLRYVMQYLGGRNYELTSHHTVLVETRNQSAASKLDIRGDRIVLTQEFREGSFYSSSAVAIGVVGRKAKAKYVNDSTVRLSAAPGKGSFSILMASAASFDPNQDVAALALNELDAAASRSFDDLLASNRTWWHDFWSKAFISLHSSDGVADEVELNTTYFLYVMASSSGADYPPRYGGMLWYTNGDMREWGSQYWWHNEGCYYNGLGPANRLELMDPMFSMYSKMYDSCALAARQQWGSQGIYIPETTFFDGLENLPDDIAAEMRELYLLRKPWEQRSTRFREFADPKPPHSSRWNWKGVGKWVNGTWTYTDKGAGPYGAVNHILSSGAKIAFLYWQRYEYTQDQIWLRDRTYPILKGIAEFYRNFPNVKKGMDGKYHIHYVNNHEPIEGAQDTMEEISAMRGIFPMAIRASEILGVDAEIRPVWREFVENLAPLPTNEMPDTLDPRQPGDPLRWTAGLKPFLAGNPRQLTLHILVPAYDYDLCTAETEDAEMVKMANATFEAIFPEGISTKTPVTVLSLAAVAAAYLGRADDLRWLLPNQIRSLRPENDYCDWPGLGKVGVMRNRMTLREGPGDNSAQRLGRALEALHTALLQSVPPAPGQDIIIHVFPAWPKEWNARYTLLARGAFLVTSSVREGEVEFVELRSQAGGECRLRNPWTKEKVTLYRDGKKSEELTGSLLTFNAAKDENIVVVRGEVNPERYKASV
jgi:hypothetical protein